MRLVAQASACVLETNNHRLEVCATEAAVTSQTVPLDHLA
jgi:hypothetical protein